MISSPSSNAPTSVASLETDEQSAHRIADLIAESFDGDAVAVSLVDAGAGRWRLSIYFRVPPDEHTVRALAAAAAYPAAAAALRFARVAAKDWVGESLAGLKPVAAGRFVVHGGHDRARIPINRIGIEIEAALAFGTGHHGTTRGCLLALDRICKSLSAPSPCKAEGRGGGQSTRSGQAWPPAARARRLPSLRATTRILDLGTGSGVLAIAAARTLRRRVLASDNDAQAVQAARANATLNRVGPLLDVIKADGVVARELRDRAPFDLIFANILLRPLQRFAVQLTRLAAPGARIVLSGLLPAQANAALAAYHALALERRIDVDGWTTLVLRRGAMPRAGVARHRPRP